MRLSGGNRHNVAGKYVQIMASETQTMKIFIFTPAQAQYLNHCDGLQSARITPGLQPICPAGSSYRLLSISLKVLLGRDMLKKHQTFE